MCREFVVMRRLWAVLGALIILISGIALVCLLFVVAYSPVHSAQTEESLLPIHAVAFCPDGRRVVTLNQGGPVRLWDLTTGKELSRIKPESVAVTAVAVSPDGRFIAESWNSLFPQEYGTGRWDIATGSHAGRFLGHTSTVNGITFTPDGRRILSASSDRTVRVWDVGTGREIHCLRGHEGDVNAVAVSSDSHHAFSAGGDYWGGQIHDPTVRLWDLESGSMVRVFRGHSGAVNDVSISPDGRLAASVSWDGTVRIWDVASGQQTRSCQRSPHAAYNAVAFSPDGKSLLTGAGVKDGKVQLWDVATGQELRDFELRTAAYDVAFSPDAKQALSAQGNFVTLPASRGFSLMYAEGEIEQGVAIL
jgi:WD40 repeat protein